jgi:hypothetical protein
MTPRQPLTAFLGGPHRGERFGAAQQGEVQLAALHGRRGVVDEFLRDRAADPGVDAVSR